MFGLGTQELVIILIIVLVLFGSTKLPQLAKGLGQSMKELRKGLSDDPHTPDTKTEDKTEDKKEQQGDTEKKA